MSETPENFIAPEEPTTEAGFKEVADSNMGLGRQAQSEVREEMMNKLSPEQKKILGEAQLQYAAREYPNRVYNGSKNSKEELIKGSVKIEEGGVPTDIELARVLKYREQELAETDYVARIDSDSFTGEDAKKLFEFYLPIAEIFNETTHFPTDRSHKVLNEKTIDKLLGK